MLSQGAQPAQQRALDCYPHAVCNVSKQAADVRQLCGLAHVRSCLSAVLMPTFSSFRVAERAPKVWARSLAASTALLSMEASCTAQGTANQYASDRTEPGRA